MPRNINKKTQKAPTFLIEDVSRHKKHTLLMKLSCSSARLAILTACLDNTSFIWDKNKTNPHHKNKKHILCVEMKWKMNHKKKKWFEFECKARTNLWPISQTFSSRCRRFDVGVIYVFFVFRHTHWTTLDGSRTNNYGDDVMFCRNCFLRKDPEKKCYYDYVE